MHLLLKLLLIPCALCGPASAQIDLARQAIQVSDRIYDQWTIFTHPKSGYQLPIPPRVRALGVPETQTKATFVSPDGGFAMTAWAGLTEESPSHVFEREWRRAREQGGRAIDYQTKSKTWFVVSGTDASGMEFYHKFTMQGNHIGAFELSYPRARLWEFEPWVIGIEEGFRLVAPPEGEPGPTPRFPGAPPRSIPGDPAPDSPDTTARETIPTRPTVRDREPGPTLPPASNRESASRETPPPTRTTPPPTRAEVKLRDPSPSLKLDRPADPEPKAQTTSLPIGKDAPGKPGFVYSPFDAGRLVDVSGIPSGTKVKCPYTMKIFLVP